MLTNCYLSYEHAAITFSLLLLAKTAQKVISFGLSMWLIGTVRAEPETVISRAWVQSPDPAE